MVYNKKGFTAVLVVFLTVAVLVMVAATVWYLSTSIRPETAKPNLAPVSSTAKPQVDQQTQKLETQSNSDEVSDIEKDLNNTDVNNIDAEMSEVDKELQNI